MAHKLFNELTAANVTDEEIEDLYNDLKFVFDSPFDTAIDEAIKVRKCAYIEQARPLMH